jgi:hypothetical protein
LNFATHADFTRSLVPLSATSRRGDGQIDRAVAQ